MKIVAFGASTSKQSINKQFAYYTAQQLGNDIELLDLNDYPLALFSTDVEKEEGIPKNVILFHDKLKEADLIVISLAEHNGSYTAAFKNLFDWLSRYNAKAFKHAPVVLVSTAPGSRGGKGVMEAAMVRFPFHGAEIKGQFSLPSFKTNFSVGNGIVNDELKRKFDAFVQSVKNKLNI